MDAGVGCVILGTGGAAQAAIPQVGSIRQQDLRADLFFFASDEMRGRLPTTTENSLAAAWIAARFERLGLAPARSDSYYQPFTLTATTLGAGNSLEQALYGKDFYTLRFSGSGRARGEVVFAGFGITAPRLGYDDYRGADIAGRDHFE